MNNNNIIIISQPIRSGKTTALMNRINVVKGVDGILSPDVNGPRKLLFIGKRNLIDFETLHQHDSISIGRFHFSNKAFEMANNYLINIQPQSHSEIIIDEIGKLELNETGFYAALVNHLKLVRHAQSNHRLVLVVRDSLLEDVKTKFGIEDAEIITIDKLNQNEKLANNISLKGLVLCGGNSARMGTDKAFLHYHQKEQYKYIASLFTNLNIPVLISCNESQQEKISNDYVALIDDEEYKNNGPISGLLTAFKNYHEDSFILVGCDYPLIQQHHIDTLVSLSGYGFDAVCYVRQSNTSLHEPLITFYNYTFKEKLLASFHLGNSSIKRVLDEVNTLKIIIEDEDFLKSFDMPQDFHSFQA
jgi:molybdopterin-guanine dinucleotide biosynthesis protein A/nucleoside-triphosphatase THEP1